MTPPWAQFVVRNQKALTVLIVPILWLPWILFLLLVTSVQWHWWQPPWSAGVTRVLIWMLLSTAMWACAINAFLGCFAIRPRPGDHPNEVDRDRHRIESFAAVDHGIVAAWTLLVLIGHSMVFVLWLLPASWLLQLIVQVTVERSRRIRAARACR